jgi:hypothetical protein
VAATDLVPDISEPAPELQATTDLSSAVETTGNLQPFAYKTRVYGRSHWLYGTTPVSTHDGSI